MRRLTFAAGTAAALAMLAVLGIGFLAGSDSANSSAVEFDNDGDGCSDLEEFRHDCRAKAAFPQFLTDMTGLASLEDLGQLIVVDFAEVLEHQVRVGLGGPATLTEGETLSNGGTVTCIYPNGTVVVTLISFTEPLTALTAEPLTAPTPPPTSDHDVLEEEENEHVPTC